MNRAVLAAAFLFVVHAPAQIEIRPVPHSDVPVPTGPATASIQGVVLNDITREPIKKARVTLNGFLSSGPATAVTDISGTFEFTQVPAGTFTVMCTHPAFDENRGMLLGDNQKQITVTAGQHVTDVELRLTPTGAISGHLIDEYGDPAEQCEVRAMLASARSDAPQVRGVANSDDRGEYRIGGLPADRYYVQEHCSGTLAAPHGFLARGDPRTPAFVFVAEFYGGSPRVNGATPVIVHAGVEVRNIDFRLKTAPAVPVRFAIESDEPVNPALIPVTVLSAAGDFHDTLSSRSGWVARLPPGSYTAVARSQQEPRLFGETSFEVTATSEAVVAMRIAPPMTISGAIRVEDDEKATAAPVQVVLSQVGQLQVADAPQPVFTKDGQFTIAGVNPGRWRVHVTDGLAAIRSATFGDRDISPASFTIPPGSSGPLNLVVTTKRIPVAFSIPHLEGDRQAWIITTGKTSDDSMPVAMVGNSSSIMVPLAPGEYRVYAVECATPAAMDNSGLWHAVADRGKALEVNEDSHATVTLDLITRDDLKAALDREVR